MRRTTSRRLMAVVTAVVVAVTGGVVLSSPADAATTAGSVKAGTWLNAGDAVTSPNGQFRLVMQGDGNLVEYGIGGAVLWASGTANWPGASTVVNTDGVVTIQRKGQLIARYGTGGRVGKQLQVGADGVISSLDTAGRAVWQANAFQSSVGAGQVIASGTTLRSDAGNSRTLTMQADGNLVQTVDGKATWNTKTFRHPGAYAAVQADGNLVVYGPDKKALWASSTSRAGGGQLLVQVDGNVVLYGKAGTRVWSTKKVTGLLWPVAGTTISGRYGDDRGAGHVPRYHQGTDAPVKVGTPVYASGKGTVTTVVQNNASYGNYIVVTYGLTTVLTAHLSKTEVTTGQIVSTGTEIAKSGNTGQSTGPHVHVETRVNGTLTDPLTLLHFR